MAGQEALETYLHQVSRPFCSPARCCPFFTSQNLTGDRGTGGLKAHTKAENPGSTCSAPGC